MPSLSYNILNAGAENVALIAPAANERIPVVAGLCARTMIELERQFPDLAPGQPVVSPVIDPARLALTHYASEQEVYAATAAVDAAAPASAEIIKGVINAA